MIYQKNFKLKGKKKLRLQAAGCLKNCLKKKKKKRGSENKKKKA